PAPLEMFETIIQFKPRDQWRPGITTDKLVEELDRVVRVPGLANIWVPPIRNRIDMLATGIKSAVGVKVAGQDLAEIDRATREIRDSLEKLRALPIVTERGARLVLADIADIRITDGPPMLRSENARLSGWVYVDIRGRDLRSAVLDMQRAVADKVKLAPGYSV